MTLAALILWHQIGVVFSCAAWSRICHVRHWPGVSPESPEDDRPGLRIGSPPGLAVDNWMGKSGSADQTPKPAGNGIA